MPELSGDHHAFTDINVSRRARLLSLVGQQDHGQRAVLQQRAAGEAEAAAGKASNRGAWAASSRDEYRGSKVPIP
jgi:hypothetical protein